MLTVNLLPEELRKPSLSPIEQFHRTPLMWIMVGMIVALPGLVLISIAIRGRQLHRLNARIAVLDPKKLEVDRLQRVLHTLQVQEAAFQGLAKGEGLWAKRLNTISDVTPEGVWFTEMNLDLAKGLVIQGSAVGGNDAGMLSVTHFVNGLKQDPDFMTAVKDIQIESIKRDQDGGIDIVKFTLNCALAEKGAQVEKPKS